MTRTICLVVMTLCFAFTMAPRDASAQDTPKKTVPSFVSNPWANPAFSYYSRQRDIRDQKAQDQRIQQLQKLELLKAANNKAKTEQQESDAIPTGSVKYKSTPATSAKTKPSKDKLLMGKTKDKPQEVTVPVENPLKGSTSNPGYSQTFSKYRSLIRK